MNLKLDDTGIISDKPLVSLLTPCFVTLGAFAFTLPFIAEAILFTPLVTLLVLGVLREDLLAF